MSQTTSTSRRASSSTAAAAAAAAHASTHFVLVRKNDTFVIPRTENFKQFRESVARHLQASKELRFYYSTDKTNTAIASDAELRRLVAVADEVRISVLMGSESLETVVDITPSKNILLKAGTSDYNMSCAVAELIDNSIQALRFNTDKRRIQVRIGNVSNVPGHAPVEPSADEPKPDDPIGPLYIWDNGCGMTFDELTKWATMGISQSDQLHQQAPSAKLSKPDPERKADSAAAAAAAASEVDASVVTGQISRFGVGAKRAAFFLGRRIKVTTKSSKSSDVCELVLSEEALGRYAEQEWKVAVKRRPPKLKTESDESFTSIKIDQMTLPYTQADTETVLKMLRRELGRIYYYYTHAHVHDYYSIRVGGQKLDDDTSDDMQTLYQRFGSKNELRFDYEMPIPPTWSTTSSTAPADEAAVRDLKQGKTQIRALARYFPFEGENETMPVPYDVMQHLHIEGSNTTVPTSVVPLLSRRPGVEVYWNGRLIPEAHLSTLGFMTPLGTCDGVTLLEEWKNRVRITVFLGAIFPVTHNKMHLVVETPIVRQLISYTTRQLQTKFRQWLLECHRQFDQEVKTTEHKWDSKRGVTTCKSVSRGPMSISVNAKISVNKGNSLRYGRVKEIFFKGEENHRQSETFVTIEPYTHVKCDDETYPAVKVNEVLSVAQWDAMLKEQQAKLPSRLKCVGGDDTNERAHVPSKLPAGAVLPWVNVHVLDGHNKLITQQASKELGLQITVAIKHVESGVITFERDSNLAYKAGRFSFKDVGGFKQAGRHVLLASCVDHDNILKIPIYTHDVTVTVGEPAKMVVRVAPADGSVGVNPAAGAVCEALLGQPLPQLHVMMVDSCDNPTGWPAGVVDRLRLVLSTAFSASAPSATTAAAAAAATTAATSSTAGSGPAAAAAAAAAIGTAAAPPPPPPPPSEGELATQNQKRRRLRGEAQKGPPSAATVAGPTLTLKYLPLALAAPKSVVAVAKQVLVNGAHLFSEQGAVLDGLGFAMYKLDVKLEGANAFESEPLLLRVRAGVPHALELVPAPDGVPAPFSVLADDATMPSVESGAVLENPVCVRVLDEWGNAVPRCAVVIRGDALDDGTSQVAQSDASGVAHIGGVLLRRKLAAGAGGVAAAAGPVTAAVRVEARLEHDANSEPTAQLPIYVCVMPSRRPSRLRLTAVVDDEHQACSVESPVVDGAPTPVAAFPRDAPIDAVRWRVALLDEAGEPCTALPRKAKLETSLVAGFKSKSLNAGDFDASGSFQLPVSAVAPGTIAHWVQLQLIDPPGETIKLSFDVRVPTPPATALLLNTVQGGDRDVGVEVMCGHELLLKVGARDGQNHQALLPLIEHTSLENLFEFTIDPPTVSAVMMRLPRRDPSDKFYEVALALGGPAGDATIRVTPKQGVEAAGPDAEFFRLRSDKLALKLLPGDAYALLLRDDARVGSARQLTFDVDNGGKLAPFVAVVADEHGNNVGAKGVAVYLHCDTLVLSGGFGGAATNSVTNQRGEAHFGGLLVHAESVPSTHQISVSLNGSAGAAKDAAGAGGGRKRAAAQPRVRRTRAAAADGHAQPPVELVNVVDASVSVQVQAGRVPGLLQVLDGDSSAVQSGELLVSADAAPLARVRVRVVAENGDVLSDEDVPTTSLSLNINGVTVTADAYERATMTHSFSNVALPKRAGIYDLLIECLPGSTPRPLQTRVVVRVTPGRCVGVDSEYPYLPFVEQEPPNNAVIGLANHELEKGLRLTCVDAHSNPVPLGDANAASEFALEFRVAAPPDGADGAAPPGTTPPQLEGETRVPIDANGVALVRTLSVTPGSFVPGVWQLVASAARRTRGAKEAWAPWAGVAPWRAELALRDAEKAAADKQRRPDLATRLALKNRRADAEMHRNTTRETKSCVLQQLTRARQESQQRAGGVARAVGGVRVAAQHLQQLLSGVPRPPIERVGEARVECAMVNGVAVPLVATKALFSSSEPRVEEAASVAAQLYAALEVATRHAVDAGGRAARVRRNALADRVVHESRSMVDNGGVLGVVSELFFCDNEREAHVLAALFASHLNTVVVLTSENAMFWRQRLSEYDGRVDILALDLCPYDSSHAADGELRDEQWGERLIQLVAPTNNPRGFIDFAVNRAAVRGAHARHLLRRRLAFQFLGRTMLFDTMQNAIDYRQRMMTGDPNRRVPTIGVLETSEILSGSGSMSVGKGARNDQCLGSTPRAETALGRSLQALFESARALVAATDNALGAQDSENPVVRKLEQELADAQAQEERAQSELAEIDRELAGHGVMGASQMSQAAVSQAAALTRPKRNAEAAALVGDLNAVFGGDAAAAASESAAPQQAAKRRTRGLI